MYILYINTYIYIHMYILYIHRHIHNIYIYTHVYFKGLDCSLQKRIGSHGR